MTVEPSMRRDFSRLVGQYFDVLVCGGGVYGAWTAYDAALRGLKVAIVDQGDWAGATSSASSKLIHGGLRYLETLNLKLVKKTLREREMLLKNAPHRVWPLRFGIPVLAGGRLNSLRLAIGLTLYDFLAGVLSSDAAHRSLNRAEFAGRFPGIDSTTLKRGFLYTDAQTDDARFVLELIAGAMSAGAVCVNYCKVTGFIEKKGQITGAHIVNQVDGSCGQLFTRQIVNTTGQWISETEPDSADYRLSKGVHLILPNLLGNDALLLTAKSDGRVFFMIPWYGLTLLGTTDTPYRGDIDRVTVEADDVDYLLSEVNRLLNSVTWTEADIIGRFAGLRVLRQGPTETLSTASRDWILKSSGNGVLTSIGGKFTSAREDAAHIVDTVCANLAHNASCRTFGLAFPWSPARDFSAWSKASLKQAGQLGIDSDSAQWLIRRHGKRVQSIFKAIEKAPWSAHRISPALPFIFADLLYCARHEMVVRLEDLIRRRMPLLILANMTRAEWLHVAGTVAETLGWSEENLRDEVETCAERWLQHPD
ncbi:MAG: glycerol-3-phosphate dehydrogenase/oxidase [Gammaproteobacteria bacterium]